MLYFWLRHAPILLTLYPLMIDGVSKSVVMLLGARVSKWKQGGQVRCARILTDLSDYRVCIRFCIASASTTPRASAGLKEVRIQYMSADLCGIHHSPAANMHPEEC